MIEGQRSTNPLNTDSSVVAFISPQPPFPLLPPPPISPPFLVLLLCLFLKSARVRWEGEQDKSWESSKKRWSWRKGQVWSGSQVWRTITPLWAASFESCQPEPHACDKGWGGGGDRSSRVLSLLQEKREHEINRKMGLKTFGLKSLTFYFTDWLVFPL